MRVSEQRESAVERILHRIEEHVEEWWEKLWAAAPEREKHPRRWRLSPPKKPALRGWSRAGEGTKRRA